MSLQKRESRVTQPSGPRSSTCGGAVTASTSIKESSKPTAPSWYIELESGWSAWSPGVPLESEPAAGTSIRFRMGKSDFEAHFESNIEGTQTNLSTGKVRCIRMVPHGEALPKWESCGVRRRPSAAQAQIARNAPATNTARNARRSGPVTLGGYPVTSPANSPLHAGGGADRPIQHLREKQRTSQSQDMRKSEPFRGVRSTSSLSPRSMGQSTPKGAFKPGSSTANELSARSSQSGDKRYLRSTRASELREHIANHPWMPDNTDVLAMRRRSLPSPVVDNNPAGTPYPRRKSIPDASSPPGDSHSASPRSSHMD